MRALIFGASAGVGRQLARTLAASGWNLTLMARNEQDLQAEASHCALLYGVETDFLALDASDPGQVSERLERFVCDAKHSFRVLAFPVGGGIEKDVTDTDPEAVSSLMATNLISVIGAVRVLQHRLEAGHVCTIVGFGSIAAARGRSHNVAYSAAKRGLASYFESVRHSARDGVVIQYYNLGFVATQQSFGKKLALPAVDPDRVAKYVVAHLGIDFGSRYFPRFWAAVALGLRLLPWRLFRRLRF